MSGEVRPQPDRLYGRQSGHRLRPRQLRLLETALPRLRFPIGSADDPPAAFGARPERLLLEIGFGGGEHAEAIARAHPEAGLIASEVFSNGICSLLSRLVPDGAEATADPLPNLRLWDADARTLVAALPDRSLAGVFLMFPDPWPKARHAKRRFVHPANVAALARVMAPGAEWRVASDDPTYQDWVAGVMAAQDAFEVRPTATARPEGWPPTRYEIKAKRAGRVPLYWSFTRLG